MLFCICNFVWCGLVGVRGCVVVFGVCGNGSIGCTNNNYASREKCKKCGQPKEVAAMPAIAMAGASLPTYSHYLASALGAPGQNMNPLQLSLPLRSNWSAAGFDQYGLESTSSWPLRRQNFGHPFANPANHPLSTPKGWRNGDWVCNCGFHNYSSRSQCKSCDASMPPALGTKRLASEELSHEWDSKRLNLGYANGQEQPYSGFDRFGVATGNLEQGVYASYHGLNPGVTHNWQLPIPFPHQVTPTLFGKGAKQWRSGDWMCTNCDNHNYASRSECNRCKTQRDTVATPVSAE